MHTHFLSPGRAPKSRLHSQVTFLQSLSLLNEVTEVLPEVFLVLNRQRQIVYSNRALTQFVQSIDNDAIGKRVGEAFNCIHAMETKGGCGTTEFCRQCGAAKAILKSQHGETNDQYTAFTVSDRSHENRRSALERIFFHDVLNTAGALLGFMKLSKDVTESE